MLVLEDVVVIRGKSIARVCASGVLQLLLVAILMLTTLAHSASVDDLLEPEQAFRFLARAIEPSAIEVEFEIAEGYYLYREKFAFAAEPVAVKPGR